MVLMLLGLMTPAATAVITVFTSGSRELKSDLKRKLVGFYRVKLLTILLASVIEEVGWRGYGEDSVAFYFSWFTESIIFGFVWALWHLPLFWIVGTYHYGLRELGIGYMLNFLISIIPLGFLTTWVYVKNNRSMLACIIFHLFVNTMQEKIAMTPQTKCVETIVVFVAAALVVCTNREMFFEKEHIGKIINQ
jgi:membrane protease YdiL (CAAX protease family)